MANQYKKLLKELVTTVKKFLNAPSRQNSIELEKTVAEMVYLTKKKTASICLKANHAKTLTNLTKSPQSISAKICEAALKGESFIFILIKDPIFLATKEALKKANYDIEYMGHGNINNVNIHNVKITW